MKNYVFFQENVQVIPCAEHKTVTDAQGTRKVKDGVCRCHGDRQRDSPVK